MKVRIKREQLEQALGGLLVGLGVVPEEFVVEVGQDQFLIVEKDDFYGLESVKAQSFWEGLKSDPTYSHIDIDQESMRMDVWLKSHPGRKKTKQFILNWLNRIERPVIKGADHDVRARLRSKYDESLYG